MKVQLQDKKENCRAYGLDFDADGVANAEKDVVQSLIESGALVEVKPARKAKKAAE